MPVLLTPAERVILAFDFKPGEKQGRLWVRDKVLHLCDRIADTGVYVKVNSALRAVGYDLLDEIRARNLRRFADHKLNDIPETLATDGALLREANPEILTAMCSTGAKALLALKAELPHTEILGVTTLTSLEEEDTHAMFSCGTEEATLRFASVAKAAGLPGLISAPKELRALKQQFEALFTLNTPAIRPHWYVVKNDDQNPARVMTPAKAIGAGALRIVIGRPVTGADDPRDALLRTIDEVAEAM